MKIIFIIYNIFEVKSGVSNKYIHFFDFLNKKDIDFIILTTFNQSIKKDISIYNYIEFKGVNVPFYEYLKIPYINLDDLKKIVNHNDIIIFHSEFYWLYSLLNEIKNSYINIKLIPNWHTNYDYYTNIYFNNSSLLFKIKNILYKNLENNFFSGLITTGEISKNTFLKYNSNIFNANEICLENFNKFKINKYNQKETINIIHTGRIALEKNLLLIIDILIKLEEIKMNNYVMHFIGCGPYVKNLKKYIMKQDMNVKYIISDKIKYYGDIQYNEIIHIYNKLENRIFIQPSISETFGKSTMEASYCGIPIFIKKCEIHDLLYNENNAFIFEDVNDFIFQFILFFKLKDEQKESILNNGFHNAEKYNQKHIFNELLTFINQTKCKNTVYYNENITNYLFNGLYNGIHYLQK